MKVIHNKTYNPYTIINFEKKNVTKLNLSDIINATIEFMYKTSVYKDTHIRVSGPRYESNHN